MTSNHQSVHVPGAVLPEAKAAAVVSDAARGWTAVACLAFATATLYAIAVVIFRLPALSIDNGRLFRVALAMHVELAVFFWLMASAAAQWTAWQGTRAWAWPAAAGGVGALILALSPLFGGIPVMADYFPWLAGNPVFATGFAVFSVAVLATAAAALIPPRGASPVFWRGVQRSALPAVMAVVTFGAEIVNGARGVAELAWGVGHALLFVHVSMMCWEWQRLAGGGDRVDRGLTNLVVATSVLLPLIPFFYAPGSVEHRAAYTLAMSWLLWPPALVVGWRAWRRSAQGNDADISRLALGISVTLFVVGCLLGSLIHGETTLVTAHYHAAVGAVAISRMGLAYRRPADLAFVLPSLPHARRQLCVYALGLVLLFSGLTLASVEGAPRKTSAAETVVKGPYFRAGMAVSGVGGVFAMVGAAWLVINLCRSRGGAARVQSGRTRE